MYLRCVEADCLSVEGTTRLFLTAINKAIGWPAAPVPPLNLASLQSAPPPAVPSTGFSLGRPSLISAIRRFAAPGVLPVSDSFQRRFFTPGQIRLAKIMLRRGLFATRSSCEPGCANSSAFCNPSRVARNESPVAHRRECRPENRHGDFMPKFRGQLHARLFVWPYAPSRTGRASETPPAARDLRPERRQLARVPCRLGDAEI